MYRIFLIQLLIAITLLLGFVPDGESAPLRRAVPDKETVDRIVDGVESGIIVFKLAEGYGQPELVNGRFDRSGGSWDRLNSILIGAARGTDGVRRHFSLPRQTLNQMRDAASGRARMAMPDLSLYHELHLSGSCTASERLEVLNDLLGLDIIEVAYFKPIAVPAGLVTPEDSVVTALTALTPIWESGQVYLQAAPAGIDAYYAWDFPYGKGEGIKLIDIEGNWIQTHQDLHHGTDNFHIAGDVIEDPIWWNHGTAVLGEVAADSNNFGMTGIAFNVELGTISVGSMIDAEAIALAVANSDTGDVILIELQTGGPGAGYIPIEWYQAAFDAIFQATALGRIVVEAGANGNENLDDTTLYGHAFDPAYRFSGALLVGATSLNHWPLGFTDYGQRVDVHAFGENVYTLGYGDLYGSSVNDYYTAWFSGTSSASPIIAGSAIVLQGLCLQYQHRVMDHNEMRGLMQGYSTPQMPHAKHVGPMPDLRGSALLVVGANFTADIRTAWVPFDVSFTGESPLAVDTWSWDFGDGGSSSEQAPVHAYTQPGVREVSLTIDAGADQRTLKRSNYIIGLADSLRAINVNGAPGSEIEVTIRGRNNVPLNYILIPVYYPGDLPIHCVGFSTVGCRTADLAIQSFVHYNDVGQQATIRLQRSAVPLAPLLPPGEGDMVKVRFQIDPSAEVWQTANIVLSGYGAYLPTFSGPLLTYPPSAWSSGLVGVCFERGDMDGLSGLNVSDLTYLVNYLFRAGPEPMPVEAADVNCSGGTNVTDLTYLVNYLFKGGAAPCGC